MMRAAAVGFLAVMLSAGAAQAGACAAGHVAFVEQPNENRPGDLLTFEARAFSLVTKQTEAGPFRTATVRGVAGGKPYILELLMAPKMLGSPVSYDGSKSPAGVRPRWGASFSQMPWADGEKVFVAGGPLNGPWQVRCTG